ncbi:MAG: ester cyclase [Pleurocapsa minor HA4230-MV1]|jgi:predicted ester cyclase|nr:ester cyclase [Pleurocapsa minor HA4230-MV1]
MLIEENKNAIHRLFEALSQGNMDTLDELMIADLILHGDDLLPFGRGRESIKKLITAFRTAFPDVTFTLEQIFAEQDKVVSYVTTSATHKGQWLGAAPTGKEITWTASAIARFNEGKIVELWGIKDELGMMQQLELVPMIGG